MHDNEQPAFKTGQHVMCVDAEATFNKLAEGVVYTVQKCDGNAVYVNGVRDSHMSERFVPID